MKNSISNQYVRISTYHLPKIITTGTGSCTSKLQQTKYKHFSDTLYYEYYRGNHTRNRTRNTQSFWEG